MNEKKGSQDRFGYEWNKYNKIIPIYETQFLKWVYPLNKSDFKNKLILDAGCGIGRNSYWPIKYGAKEVYSFDYDKRTVNIAKQNLLGFSNSEVFFESIYDLKFKNKFDLAFSIGVIHHLEFPHKAIQKVIDSLKTNGKILIWVYGYEGNEWIVKYINPIRKITSRIPVIFTHILTYSMSIPLYFYIKTFKQKNKYLNQLKKFKFWHINSIVFDQLLPKIANYWTKTEALSLLENKGLKDIEIHRVNENSWTVIGTK